MARGVVAGAGLARPAAAAAPGAEGEGEHREGESRGADDPTRRLARARAALGRRGSAAELHVIDLVRERPQARPGRGLAARADVLCRWCGRARAAAPPAPVEGDEACGQIEPSDGHPEGLAPRLLVSAREERLLVEEPLGGGRGRLGVVELGEVPGGGGGGPPPREPAGGPEEQHQREAREQHPLHEPRERRHDDRDGVVDPGGEVEAARRGLCSPSRPRRTPRNRGSRWRGSRALARRTRGASGGPCRSCSRRRGAPSARRSARGTDRPRPTRSAAPRARLPSRRPSSAGTRGGSRIALLGCDRGEARLDVPSFRPRPHVEVHEEARARDERHGQPPSREGEPAPARGGQLRAAA